MAPRGGMARSQYFYDVIVRTPRTIIQLSTRGSLFKELKQNQIFLEQIGVSNDQLLSITKEIEKITFGAKITGAGDGGCIIALTEKDNDLSEYVNTTKYQTHQVSIQKTGMQVFNT